MRPAAIVALAAVLVLGACSGSRKDAGAGTAEGEILPGSTSDAMLPYDTVRSHPPLAPRPEASAQASESASEAAPEPADAGDQPPTQANR